MLQIYPAHDLEQVATRLHGEFGVLSHPHVERCVADAWKCAEHLGFEVTIDLVERVARERLQAMIKSEPPSAATLRPRLGEHDRLR
ncbi:hypothetical protein F4561_003922 [Lipingzhangella halophila]|uniref:Uncharacterized protein n=1 Tax=Lipingzhangella halophila TaxID=1783352 RepID=A0A7W7W3J1_9ACTN|nr:hypothetical protein [Lipingzhangella halophila]MBB4933102.1 hypothetical protein [Lipingzhangella halophila]